MPIFDLHVTDDIKSKINKNDAILLVFHQPGCGACTLYETTIDEINVKHGINGLVVIRFNVRDNIQFARENNIQGTPTTFLYKNGEKVFQFDGYVATETLEKHLQNYKLV
ncbi:thioredoxin family protein [Mycoplasma sp. 'Moose RK']|uniref:thioredoxin family protein n=1 Tax=Mycoplasma sp. 'Moose RK' TaxID=2780095 RepID=UPI0018C2CDBE|nr:thioredoxin family protein [Mycoplasma sp. 'Moose RK']MBG0730681.1 thioredoxin family protein [Mycoplasma sp. 'Moose RK']